MGIKAIANTRERRNVPSTATSPPNTASARQRVTVSSSQPKYWSHGIRVGRSSSARPAATGLMNGRGGTGVLSDTDGQVSPRKV